MPFDSFYSSQDEFEQQKISKNGNKPTEKSFLSTHSLDSQSQVKTERSKSVNFKSKAVPKPLKTSNRKS